MGAEDQKTILLVDYEALIAMTVKMTLEKYGYKVIIANSGEQAVAAVEKTPGIDLILMDINLGAGMDGTEAAEIILRQRDLPVVFLSSHTEPEIVARTEKITSYGYVVKNSGDTVLQASIKMAFKLFEATINEKEKEKALRESEKKYKDLVENANSIIIRMDQNGILTFVNNYAQKFFGYTWDEIIGKNVRILVPLTEISGRNLKEMADKILRDPDDYIENINENIRKNGERVWISWRNKGIRDANGKLVGNLAIGQDITELKQAESQKEAALAALCASEEKLRVLFEQLPIGVSLLGKNRKITYVNPALEKILDISKDDLLQEKYQTRRYIRPDGTTLPPEEFASVRAFKEQKIVRDIEIGVITESGKTIWTNVSAVPFPIVTEGLLIVTVDITERKQAEAVLRESEVRFRELFNRMSSGVAVYEAIDNGGDFIFRDFNTAAEKIEKVSRKDIIGKRVSEVFPGVKAFGVFKVFQKVWQTGKPEYFPDNIYKDEKNSGSWRESWVFKLPTGEIVAIYNDITERKRAEEEIKRQLSEKEILLKEVHHRIKNNIASIGGLISLQMQSVTNSEAVAVLKDASSRVNSMRILYDKLLLSEDYKDISVKNYLDDLIDAIGALFPDMAKVTVDKRIADFHLDAKRLFPLGSIINELLNNTMKYAFISRDAGLIKISLAHADNHVTLIIQDNGAGLPAGFDIDKSKGLGLTLVKMLSQQLGGSFTIKKHAGTRCKVEFDI